MNEKSLQHAILQGKVQRARQMSLDDRLGAGARLHAEQLVRTRDLLAGLHPDWSEREVEAEMIRHRRILRERNSKRFYRQNALEEIQSADAP